MPEITTSISSVGSGVKSEPVTAALRSDSQERFPREFQLLLACLRWPQDEVASRRIQACADPELDWSRFAQLAEHHRVQPLVHRALHSAGAAPPPAVATALKQAATRNAFAAMRYLAEAQRLSGLLRDAGIRVRLLKGVPLSQRAFGEWSLRDVGDLDLLIAPEHEERADTLLLADGLRRGEPAALLTPRRRQSYRKHAKDYTYEPGAAGFEIDLHWRLFRNPRMDGNQLAAAPSDELHIGGMTLYVLPEIHSFLYLCVHGTLDGWFRLKPVADIAALWRRFSPAERGEAIALARREGVSPELAGSLALAMHLGVMDEGDLPGSIVLQASDPVCRRVVNRALDHLRRYDYMPGAASAGSWDLKRYEMSLRSNLPYRVEILRRVLFRPRVWERFDLPDAVYPLYALLSPLEWLLFHGGRRLGRGVGLNAWWRGSPAPVKQPATVPALRAASAGRGVLSRWWRTGWAEKILTAEAALYLVAARAALSLLPLRKILERLQRPTSTPPPPESNALIQQVRWAVVSVSRHAPVRFVCFPQALAAHAMLRRRGIRSRLHYGVRRSADGRLRAHTWLEAGGETMLGGESSPLFSRIQAWPAQTMLPQTELRDSEVAPPSDRGTQL